eukprot:TRINITY_DN65962_c0_g3_i1.p1 TRINITY_DN65962_c0_g3~~TRINITY_DN65962_c0_g3_i1.p1  ORF type:complete len:282 (+),score=23.35 TRINITY_DN65962_c0_g3_i1:42-887(+)
MLGLFRFWGALDVGLGLETALMRRALFNTNQTTRLTLFNVYQQLNTIRCKRLATHRSMSHELSEIDEQDFNILEEKVVHSRYLTLYDRVVQFSVPNKQQQHLLDSEQLHKFDVVGHPKCDFYFSVVCPVRFIKDNVNKPKIIFTLIYEYCQGQNKQMFCLPTGGFNPSQHADLEQCAMSELSEEAGLTGGKIIRLLPPQHKGFAEVKWCRNRFVPYLVIDPVVDANPRQRDKEEELIQVVEVSLEELEKLMIGGDMMLPSITTCFIALKYLRQNGYINNAE